MGTVLLKIGYVPSLEFTEGCSGTEIQLESPVHLTLTASY